MARRPGRKHNTFLKAKRLVSWPLLSLVVLAVLALGSIKLFSMAAGRPIAIEAETGKTANYTYAVSSGTASGGKAISFTEGMPAPSKHAALPPGPYHTAVPTITVDVSATPGLAPWIKEVIKPLLEQWYPVLGDYYAYPDYVPPTKFTLIADPAFGGLAQTEKSEIIRFNPKYFPPADLPAATGIFLHEMTHVIQANALHQGNTPSWVTEGVADFTREQIYVDRSARMPFTNETYLSGYAASTGFLDYVRTHYDTKIIHELNVIGGLGQYSDGIFLQKTGKTLEKLWTEYTGQPITKPGRITGILGKCLDDPSFVTADGTRIKIQTCNGLAAENWILAGFNKTTSVFEIIGYGNKCLDVTTSGTANGTPVQYWGCNSTSAQQWKHQSDGSLLNVNSNKCLQPVAGSSAEGTLLEIYTCNGSAAQKWNVPSF